MCFPSLIERLKPISLKESSLGKMFSRISKKEHFKTFLKSESNNGKHFWFIFKTVVKTLVVFSPLVVATFFIISYNNSPNVLAFLNRIDGNQFTINNTLLIYITAGFGVIFIGLIFYLFGLMDDVFSYCGGQRIVLRINKSCLIALVVVIVFLVVYGLYFIISSSGLISKGNKIFNLNNLVLFNKYLTFIIFVIFCVVDILIKWSHNLQLKEHNNALTNGSSDPKLKQKIESNKNQIQLSKDATWLINIPTLFLSLLTIVFTEKILALSIYTNFIDQSFKYPPEIPDYLKDNFFHLFVNGVETGIIMSIIIFSQIVFLVIRIRWELKVMKLKH
jgi:hypothetical protein